MCKAGGAQRQLGTALEGTVSIRMSLTGMAPTNSPGKETGEETEGQAQSPGTSAHRQKPPPEGNSVPAGFSHPP